MPRLPMFRMIGHYEIKRDGDVIRVWSAHEFNLEAAQQYARDMIEAIAQMPAKFATLVEFDAPTGTATLRIEGDCPDCEMSAANMIEGIGAHLRARVPEVKDVRRIEP